MDWLKIIVEGAVGGVAIGGMVVTVVYFLRHLKNERASYEAAFERERADCALCRKQFMEVITGTLKATTEATNRLHEEIRMLREVLEKFLAKWDR